MTSVPDLAIRQPLGRYAFGWLSLVQSLGLLNKLAIRAFRIPGLDLCRHSNSADTLLIDQSHLGLSTSYPPYELQTKIS